MFYEPEYVAELGKRDTRFFLGPWPSAFGMGVILAVVLAAVGLLRTSPLWAAAMGLPWGVSLAQTWGGLLTFWLLWPLSSLTTWLWMRLLRVGEYGPLRTAQIFGRVWVIWALAMIVREVGVNLLVLLPPGVMMIWLRWFNPTWVFVLVFAIAGLNVYGLKLRTLLLIVVALLTLGLLLAVIALVRVAVLGS